MDLTYHCASCERPVRASLGTADDSLTCPHCGFQSSIPAGAWQEERPRLCLSCGNADLWRQKDFPQRLGILMVALAAVASSIAWAYHRPVLALGILAGFGLLDMALFWLMPDALVCYRCRARHHVGTAGETFSAYDHERGERYRQERLRLEQTTPRAE
jgi:hypothetical protein